MHWCADETAAALTFLDNLGLAWTWLKTKYRLWRQPAAPVEPKP